MIEVELKAKLPPQFDASELKKHHLFKDLHKIGEERTRDVYYDTREYDLLRKGIFLRERNGNRLNLKFDRPELGGTSKHGLCVEETFEVPLRSSSLLRYREIMSSATGSPDLKVGQLVPAIDPMLKVLADITKLRRSYSAGALRVEVDNVQALGRFLEIEFDADTPLEAQAERRRIEKLMADIGLSPVEVGYVELWLKLNNPRAYQLGQYQSGASE